MATAANAKLEREAGQTLFDYTAATDSGDHIVYTVSGKTAFSDASGYSLNVRPNGIVSGRNLLTTHATVETVTVAAFTFYLAGVLTSVAATTAVGVRAASDVGKICSITATGTNTIAVVEGTDSGSAAVNEVRGSAGGPPSIPVTSVEIGQIRYSSNTPAAAILSTEIFQVPDTHSERFDSPSWQVNNVGDGNAATVAAKKNAYVEFLAAHPMIHGATATSAADSYKPVYISGYTPIFSEIAKSVDFMPAQNTHSVSSVQVYNATVGSSSSSLGQGGFKALMTDGVTDGLVADQDDTLIFRFYPDRNKAPYMLTQGKLGVKSTFPVANQVQAECTISASTKTANFSS